MASLTGHYLQNLPSLIGQLPMVSIMLNFQFGNNVKERSHLDHDVEVVMNCYGQFNRPKPRKGEVLIPVVTIARILLHIRVKYHQKNRSLAKISQTKRASSFGFST